MKDIKVVRKFRGYENSQEPTNIDSLRKGVLIAPSKNVWVSRQGVVHSRQGYQQVGSQLLDGDNNPVPIRFEDTWETNRDVEYSFRAGGDYLQVFYDGDWVTIKSDLVSDRLSGTPWWDDDAVLDRYLFVDGGDSIHAWSGGIAKISAVDGTTITIESTEHIPDWADIGFNTSGTGTVIIEGVEYTYNPADGSGDLTLNTAPPVGVVGSVAIDKPETTNTFDYTIRTGTTVQTQTNRNIKTDFGFTFDIIGSLYNQIMIASEDHQRVFISKNGDYTDFRFTNQRLIGEGDSLVLDAPVNNIKIADNEGSWYLSCGNKQWYEIKEARHQVTFNAAYHTVTRLKTGYGQGAHNKYSADYVKNNIVFISKEPTMDTLGRVENINTPQAKPLSTIIENDFKLRNFDDVHVKYFKDMVLVSLPKEGVVLVRDLAEAYWQTPQTIPSNCVSVLNDELIFHDGSGKSHKLFVGYKDGIVINENDEVTSEGSNIDAQAYFSFESYANRALYKNFNKLYVETYLQDDSNLRAQTNFEFSGYGGENSFNITTKSDYTQIYKDVAPGSIGTDPLGLNPFGTQISYKEKNPFSDIRYHKVRAHIPFEAKNFFEMQHVFKSEKFFMLVSYGTNYRLSDDNAFHVDNGQEDIIEVE